MTGNFCGTCSFATAAIITAKTEALMNKALGAYRRHLMETHKLSQTAVIAQIEAARMLAPEANHERSLP